MKYASLRKRAEKYNWCCRFHPFNWWHEVGCPHREWTREQLYSALLSKKDFEQKKSKDIKEKERRE